MPVKIISGSLKGRTIKCPEGRDVRPTSSMARAAIFNVLQLCEPFGEVLDLYAGSGALGLEALSRGAASLTMVEKAAGPAAIIRENMAALKITDRAKLFVQDAPEFLRTCSRQFDLILADPPYPDMCLPAILEAVESSGALHKKGILAIQHSPKEFSPEAFGRLVLWKNKRYGKTQVSFYRYDTEV